MTDGDGSLGRYHKDHWVDIEPERLDRYERLFQLDDRRGDLLLAPVGVEAGEVIVDFGCGPGFVASSWLVSPAPRDMSTGGRQRGVRRPCP